MTLPKLISILKIWFLIMCFFVTNVNAQTHKTDSVLYLKNQDSGINFIYNIPGIFSSMKVDALENVYAISAGSLIKFSPLDNSVQTYNNIKKYGTPTLLDVTNPFKTLLYFKNYTTIVVLDKYLANKNTINLRKSGIFSVKAIGSSYDNKIWIFDEQDFKLKKIDENGLVLMESNDARIITDEVPLPSQIFDNDGFVYLYDANAGLYIFDYYGSYKGKVPFTNWSSVLLSNGHLYGLTNNKIFSYELKTKNFKEYALPNFFKNSLSIATINGKIYILKENGIDVFSSNNN